MSLNGRMLRSEKYLRLIAAVIFLALGAYAAAFIWKSGENSIITETAKYESISESFSVKGHAFRELSPIVSGDEDYIILAAEGEYLSGGSAIAVRKETADDYYAFCDCELSRESFSSEEKAVDAIRSGDAEHRALAALQLEGKVPCEKCNKPDGIIYTPCAGFFTRKGGAIGSIASSASWYFSFESEKVSVLHRGQKLNLVLASGPQTEAEIFSIDKDNGIAVLIIRSCSDFLPVEEDYTAAIKLSECEGLRVPIDAVCYDKDGTPFVKVLSAGIEERKNIEIIYTSRDYCLCSGSELREGMEIMVSDSSKVG